MEKFLAQHLGGFDVEHTSGFYADIAVGKRTILSYILSPLLEFRDGAFRAN